MKKILFLLLCLFSISVFGQININFIGVSVGYERNLQYEFVNPNYSIAPEIYFGGDLIKDLILWDVNLSYWNDGINNNDKTFYSNTSFTIGIKTTFLLDNLIPAFSPPIHFILGGQNKFTSEEIIGYSNERGSREKYPISLQYIELGGGLHFDISNRMNMKFNFTQLLPINKLDYLSYRRDCFVFKLSCDYKF